MVNFFNNIRFWGTNRNPILQRLRFYGILNLITDVVANVVIPIYFRLTSGNPQNSLHFNANADLSDSPMSVKGKTPQVIVSLTSYPLRIHSLWKVIECLLRQNVKPDRIVLYLSTDQFDSIDNLPKSLLNQRKRGLEICMCKGDLRSHKKYYYAMQQYPEDIVITVDDDLFYRTDLIEEFLKENRKRPKAIIANWVKEVLPGKNLYKEWPDRMKSGVIDHFCFIGVSGVLYPPHSLYKDVFNESMIRELCYTTDDIWLSCMAMLNHTQAYFSNYKIQHLPILIFNNQSLLAVNRIKNQESVDNLNLYYLDKLGIRPFIWTTKD